MNRRQLFLSTAKAAFLAAIGGGWRATTAAAQPVAPAAAAGGEIHGVPGSPSATRTIIGDVLPPPDPPFGGVIKGNAAQSEALVAAAGRAAQGRAERAADHDRRRRLRRAEHLRRRHPHAGPGPHRQGGAALHAVPFHGPLLADAGGADHRPQPSLGRLRRGLRSSPPASPATTASSPRTRPPSAASSGTTAIATSWFGKDHNTPTFQASQVGPFDQWPIGMGFEYFYGFVGGDTSQWQPNLFRNTTAIYPYVGKPGWNLTTADGRRRHRIG